MQLSRPGHARHLLTRLDVSHVGWALAHAVLLIDATRRGATFLYFREVLLTPFSFGIISIVPSRKFRQFAQPFQPEMQQEPSQNHTGRKHGHLHPRPKDK